MKMFGHQDVSDDTEAIFPAHVLQNFKEKLFDPVVREKWSPLVTATCNEVEVLCSVPPLETGRHCEQDIQIGSNSGGDAGSGDWVSQPFAKGGRRMGHPQ